MSTNGIDVDGPGKWVLSAATRTNHVVWKNLRQWIQQEHGGTIHEALQLQGGDDGPTDQAATATASKQNKPVRVRGVVATKAISKGEWLIRVPSSAIVSGASIRVHKEESPPAASSWLKCVAALYQTSQSNKSNWQAYLDSLPALDEYETLFQWEQEEVETNLAGTTLGSMVQADRKEDSMRKRYQRAVRPLLRELGLVVKASSDGIVEDTVTKEEFDTFLQACMCISTRGFHLTSAEDCASGGTGTGTGTSTGTDHDSSLYEYRGPFLLPVIDLLNHEPARKCTTLQRDATTGMFYMKAERDVAMGEEVFHSYGDSLTAAQMLQTFGFVPPQPVSPMKRANYTPVVLNKITHILAACEHIKASSVPKQIEDWMTSQSMVNDESEVWDVATIPNRALGEDDAPDDWLVSMDNTLDQTLSDELITFVVLQFLPKEAYDEMIDEHGNVSASLDRSILEDIYLGKLGCHAILEAIRRRKTEYVPLGAVKMETASSPLKRDIALLEELSSIASPDVSTTRAMCGLRVRIEELSSLEALELELLSLCENLENGESIPVAPINVPPPSKRPKFEAKPK